MVGLFIPDYYEAFPNYSLQPSENDVFIGSPPIGFTFGLGGLVLFPMYFGASTFLIEKPSPEVLLKAIQDYKITICFTAPTAWRIITTKIKSLYTIFFMLSPRVLYHNS